MPSIKKLLMVAAVLFPLAANACAADAEDEEGDEEVGASEDALLAGRQFSPGEVAKVLRDVGFPENQIGRMVCTAKYESTFYEEAVNNRNNNGSVDRGLFQINSIHLGDMRGCPSKANWRTLFDAETNAQCALAVFNAQGNRAWYGYRSHKRECDRTPAPASE
jgi:opacity protein-like surface antigen